MRGDVVAESPVRPIDAPDDVDERFMSAGGGSRMTRPADWLLAVASLWLVLVALAVLSVAIGIVVAVMREASGWYVGVALALTVTSVLSAAVGLNLLAVPRWRWTLFSIATVAVGAAGMTVAAAV